MILDNDLPTNHKRNHAQISPFRVWPTWRSVKYPRVIGWLDLKTYKNYPIYNIYKWTNHENQSPEKALPIKTKKLTMKRKPCSFFK